MTPEQKECYDNTLAEIRRGGTNHSVWMQDHIFGMVSYNLGPISPPVVGLSNDDDSYYCQYFQNWDEVNSFIEELRAEAIKAWGKQ